MAKKKVRVYDPVTRTWKEKWVEDKSGDSDKKSGSDDKKGGSDDKKSSGDSKGGKSGGNLKGGKKDPSGSNADKKANQIELTTLRGTLNYIPTEETIKLNAGDTVKLKGFGKYLSRNYYVVDIRRTISLDGYTNSATVICTDFGDSLKSTTKTQKKDKSPTAGQSGTPSNDTKSGDSSKSSKTQKKVRYYTVKKGDCLWSIAKKFYGNGAAFVKIFKANVGKIKNPNQIKAGTKLVIP